MGYKMFKDEIKAKIPLVYEVSNPQIIKLFKDENLMLILELLRNNRALTEKDIEKEFARRNNKKNTKTIYGYLKTLENAKLIVQAGKRVFLHSQLRKPKSETLYMRAAKIFFPVIKSDTEECENQTDEEKSMLEIIEILIHNKYGLKLKKLSSLSDFIKKLQIKQILLAREMIKEAQEDTANAIGELEWGNLESMMKILGQIAMILDQEQKLKNQLLSCFEN